MIINLYNCIKYNTIYKHSKNMHYEANLKKIYFKNYL